MKEYNFEFRFGVSIILFVFCLFNTLRVHGQNMTEINEESIILPVLTTLPTGVNGQIVCEELVPGFKPKPTAVKGLNSPLDSKLWFYNGNEWEPIITGYQSALYSNDFLTTIKLSNSSIDFEVEDLDFLSIEAGGVGKGRLEFFSNNDNINIGDGAGKSNTSATENLFIGTYAGRFNTIGKRNLYLVFRSGETSVSADDNVYIGYQSGKSNAGSGNVFIGANVATSATAYSNKLVIDNEDLGNGSLIYGDFNSDEVRINGDFIVQDDFIIGNELILDDGFNSLKFDTDIFPMSDDEYQLGKSGFRWQSVWAINGTINTSDKRVKKNIENLNYGLATVMALNPVLYNWKKESERDKKHIGLIAQELLELIPEVVELGRSTNDLMGVKYADLIPVLIKSIQELNKKIEDQSHIITDLSTSLEKIKQNE